MIVLGLDWETTGLNPQTDRIIDAGLALWDSDLHALVRMSGFLVKSNVAVSEEITKLTGITSAMLKRFGLEAPVAFDLVRQYMDMADVVCAHNGNDFDKPFWSEWAKRAGQKVPDKFWLDTYIDLPATGARLIYMAADAGFVNPFPHRALTDVLSMLRILDGHDVDKIHQRAKLPNVILQAVVSYESNALAKARSYRWNPDLRQWRKIVKEGEAKEEISEAEKAGFKVVVVK
jgi:DNA polymerase-3 subunit epsilon